MSNLEYERHVGGVIGAVSTDTSIFGQNREIIQSGEPMAPKPLRREQTAAAELPRNEPAQVVELRPGVRQQKRPMNGDLLDLLPYAVFWKDREGRFLGCNGKCARDMGFQDSSQLIGKTDFDVPHFSTEEIAFFRRCDREFMDTGRPIRDIEESQGRPGGKHSRLLTYKYPLRNDDGQIIGIWGTYIEIDEELSETNPPEKDHSLRDALGDPLTAIILTATLGSRLADQDPKLRELFETILEHASQSIALIRTRPKSAK
jgi:PAS domain-containing protein